MGSSFGTYPKQGKETGGQEPAAAFKGSLLSPGAQAGFAPTLAADTGPETHACQPFPTPSLLSLRELRICQLSVEIS